MKASCRFLALNVAISSLLLCSAITSAEAEAEFPNIKAGLWEVTNDGDNSGISKSKSCVDSKTGKELMEAGNKMLEGMCKKFEFTKSGDDYITKGSCQIGPISMKTQSIMKGDFQTHYSVTSTTEMTPAMMGQKGPQTMTSSGKYLGPCPANMKPGDVITEDGKSFNSKEMMEGMPEDLMKEMSEGLKSLPQVGQ